MGKEEKKYKEKDLSKNVEVHLRPRATQVMLSSILLKDEFKPFFTGQRKVKVFTPSKESSWGSLRFTQGKDPRLWLEIEEKKESLGVNAALLIIFPTDKANFIAQCRIFLIENGQYFIKSLDPRLSERVKSLVPLKLYSISTDLVDRIEDGFERVKRTIEYRNPTSMEDAYSCKDWFAVTGKGIEDPLARNEGLGKPTAAVIADISMGGCCLAFPRETDVHEFEKSKLAYAEFNLPGFSGRRTVSIFLLIRGIRTVEKSLVFHCMFLEAIPSEMLDL